MGTLLPWGPLLKMDQTVSVVTPRCVVEMSHPRPTLFLSRAGEKVASD